jgi:two-component system, OmpR family, KDP operon response regulator KdpE
MEAFVVLALAILLAVYEGRRTWLTPVLGGVERAIYRAAGVDERSEGDWDRIASFRLGEYEIDLDRRQAQGPAGEIHLTPLEYRVLECLVRHSGRIVRPQQLLRESWGPDKSGDTRTLRVCIKNLRDKLEPNPRRPVFLTTDVGLGYRLTIP